MRRRLLLVLVYGGGALLAALGWTLLLSHSIYDDPYSQPATVCGLLVFAAAVNCWLPPERWVTDNQDLAWLAVMIEWGLVLIHLPMLPWALLQGPLPIGLAAALVPLLGWAAMRFLGQLLPRRPRFRAVNALFLLLVGAVGMQGYLARAAFPPYCDALPGGAGGRALFRFADCLGEDADPAGLCRIPGAEIANLQVSADARHLLGTAVGEGESGLFRIDLADTSQIDFIALGGLKPRSLLRRDGGKRFMVLTEGAYNRLLWVEADPFRLIQTAALTASGEEIVPGTALSVDRNTLLVPARRGDLALEVNTLAFKVTPRRAPALDSVGPLGDAAIDPTRRRAYLTWPLLPYLRVLSLPGLAPEQHLPVGFGGSALAIDLRDDRLYLARYLWGDAVVLGINPLRDRGTLPLGYSVSRLALSPRRDMLAGLGSATGSVDVVDLRTGRPYRSWKVGRFAAGLAWSADTNRIYAGSRCGVYELDPR